MFLAPSVVFVTGAFHARQLYTVCIERGDENFYHVHIKLAYECVYVFSVQFHEFFFQFMITVNSFCHTHC